MNFSLNRQVSLSILAVFSISCIIRFIPVYLNYPYPIGYDSINYYLPFLFSFSENGINWTTSYPIYLFVVFCFSKVFLIDLYTSFNFINITLYGILGISIFLLFTRIMKISSLRGLLFSLFVLVQLSTLRISWDLHRDLLSLIFFNFCLLLINTVHKNNRISYQLGLSYLLLFCLILMSVFSDRMVSILLIITSLVCALLFKNKYLLLISSSFIILFITYFITSDNISIFSMDSGFMQTLVDPLYDLESYSIIGIFVLFLSLYGILLPFFAFGFLKHLSDFMILKVPTTIVLLCSFTWIIVPNYEYLVPERWVILSGIFISIFAAYGFSLINALINQRSLRMITFAVFFSFFISYGIIFMTSPYGTIATIPAYFHDFTQFVMPISMSMNTFDIHQNKNIVHVIDWINKNTSENSIVIGSIHWRGWFSLFLDPTIKFIKYDENNIQSSNLKNNSLFENLRLGLCNTNSSNPEFKSLSIILVSSNDYLLKNLSSLQVYDSGQFTLYNVSKILCKY